MPTTSPSWFDAWPADFPDVQDAYADTIPAQFPRGLYDDLESDEAKDIGVMSRVLSWVAQGSQWVRGRIFPQHDADGIFIPTWEDILGLPARGFLAQRQRAIVRYLRYSMGTATSGAVKAIFAPLFGEEGNTDAVAFAVPTLAQIVTAAPEDDSQYAQATCSMHIYHATETTEPDRRLVLDAMTQSQGGHERWTCGQFRLAKYDTQGGYDTACYGD